MHGALGVPDVSSDDCAVTTALIRVQIKHVWPTMRLQLVRIVCKARNVMLVSHSASYSAAMHVAAFADVSLSLTTVS